jgi:hypothetical protein
MSDKSKADDRDREEQAWSAEHPNPHPRTPGGKMWGLAGRKGVSHPGGGGFGEADIGSGDNPGAAAFDRFKSKD